MRALARIIGLVALALGGQPAVAEGLEVQPVIGGNPIDRKSTRLNSSH